MSNWDEEECGQVNERQKTREDRLSMASPILASIFGVASIIMNQLFDTMLMVLMG
jgi:hypothetical protein